MDLPPKDPITDEESRHNLMPNPDEVEGLESPKTTPGGELTDNSIKKLLGDINDLLVEGFMTETTITDVVEDFKTYKTRISDLLETAGVADGVIPLSGLMKELDVDATTDNISKENVEDNISNCKMEMKTKLNGKTLERFVYTEPEGSNEYVQQLDEIQSEKVKIGIFIQDIRQLISSDTGSDVNASQPEQPGVPNKSTPEPVAPQQQQK
eukprot:UN31250